MFLATLVAGLIIGASPVSAENASLFEGEPTDPEAVVSYLLDTGFELKDKGLDPIAPHDDEAARTWLEAVLELLRSLGFLGEGSAP